MPLAETHHVVVDGSNLATEGRTLPSLKQLDEAVRAYASEDPDASIIVVVDATFEHRVDDAEREEVRQAMLNGEIISPPAGAIGRGDAFVLRIAERTGATVLSNDSFQEFHGEHPWLFDDGRLIGGKPVPGVGWIFTPRLPDPRTQEPGRHRRGQGEEGPRVGPGQGRRAGQGGQEGGQEVVQGTQERPEAGRRRRPSTPRGRSRPRPRLPAGPRSTRCSRAPLTRRSRRRCTRRQPEKSRGHGQEERGGQEGGAGEAGQGQEGRSVPKGFGWRRRRGAAPPAADGGRNQRQRPTPPPAVNEPLTFINFVAAFPVGSTIEGEVVSFTSHGAMVDVPLPGGGAMHCYIPLTAMGTPPPTKARQVLKKGEVRPFVLAGLDPPRRVAELAIEGARSVGREAAAKKAAPAPTAKRAPTAKAAPPAKKAAAKKARTGEEGSQEGGGGGQEGAAKKAAAKKAAKAKKVPAKKAAAKKARKARAE